MKFLAVSQNHADPTPFLAAEGARSTELEQAGRVRTRPPQSRLERSRHPRQRPRPRRSPRRRGQPPARHQRRHPLRTHARRRTTRTTSLRRREPRCSSTDSNNGRTWNFVSSALDLTLRSKTANRPPRRRCEALMILLICGIFIGLMSVPRSTASAGSSSCPRRGLPFSGRHPRTPAPGSRGQLPDPRAALGTTDDRAVSDGPAVRCAKGVRTRARGPRPRTGRGADGSARAVQLGILRQDPLLEWPSGPEKGRLPASKPAWPRLMKRLRRP